MLLLLLLLVLVLLLLSIIQVKSVVIAVVRGRVQVVLCRRSSCGSGRTPRIGKLGGAGVRRHMVKVHSEPLLIVDGHCHL